MKSFFEFTRAFEENGIEGFKVWISPIGENESAPDLPILDLEMDVTLTQRLTFCTNENETKPEEWHTDRCRVLGKIVKRRLVYDSKIGSENNEPRMIYTVAPGKNTVFEIRRQICNKKYF